MVPWNWSTLLVFQWILIFGFILPPTFQETNTTRFQAFVANKTKQWNKEIHRHFGVALDDPVDYSLNLICDEHAYWCAEFYVQEEDVTGHQPWLYGSVCTNNRTANFSHVMLNGQGDGVLNAYYEVTTLIYHNCTSKQHANELLCWAPEPCSYGNEGFTRLRVGEMKTCACHLEWRKDVSVQSGSLTETIRLNGSKNAFTNADRGTCRYPWYFYNIKHSKEHVPWIRGPCDWEAQMRETGQHLINFVPPNKPGPITLNITLSCYSHQYWCADMYIYESDDSPCEGLFYGTFCSDEYTKTYAGITLYPGSDGLKDDELEIAVNIYHNCTDQVHPAHYDCRWNRRDACPYSHHPSNKGKMMKCDCRTDALHLPAHQARTINRWYYLGAGKQAFKWERWGKGRGGPNCPFPNEFKQLYEDWDTPLRWFQPPCEFPGETRELGQYAITFVRSDQPKFLNETLLKSLKDSMGYYNNSYPF